MDRQNNHQRMRGGPTRPARGRRHPQATSISSDPATNSAEGNDWSPTGGDTLGTKDLSSQPSIRSNEPANTTNFDEKANSADQDRNPPPDNTTTTVANSATRPQFHSGGARPQNQAAPPLNQGQLPDTRGIITQKRLGGSGPRASPDVVSDWRSRSGNNNGPNNNQQYNQQRQYHQHRNYPNQNSSSRYHTGGQGHNYGYHNNHGGGQSDIVIYPSQRDNNNHHPSHHHHPHNQHQHPHQHHHHHNNRDNNDNNYRGGGGGNREKFQITDLPPRFQKLQLNQQRNQQSGGQNRSNPAQHGPIVTSYQPPPNPPPTHPLPPPPIPNVSAPPQPKNYRPQNQGHVQNRSSQPPTILSINSIHFTQPQQQTAQQKSGPPVVAATNAQQPRPPRENMGGQGGRSTQISNQGQYRERDLDRGRMSNERINDRPAGSGAPNPIVNNQRQASNNNRRNQYQSQPLSNNRGGGYRRYSDRNLSDRFSQQPSEPPYSSRFSDKIDEVDATNSHPSSSSVQTQKQQSKGEQNKDDRFPSILDESFTTTSWVEMEMQAREKRKTKLNS